MRLKNNRGFTLLELLIAISLSVVIFIILFAAMRLGAKSQEKGLERGEVTQKVRIISDRLAWLLRGAYPFYLNRVEEQKIFFDGKAGALGFVTSSVDSYGKGPEDMAGLKWVYLFVDREGLKIREKVFFLSDVFEDKDGKVYLLDPDVKTMEFEYYEVPEGEKEGFWTTEWAPEDKQTIPSAVKVKLAVEQKGKKINVPEMIIKISAERNTDG
jgi:prepilin-type N-terminal cleavage/methylation domain-containing protein